MFSMQRQVMCAAMLGSLIAAPVQAGGKSHAMIAPFERFHAADTVKAGQLLLGELNCISCHQPEKGQEAYVPIRKAPILDTVGSRVKRSYFAKFLQDPHAVKPGTPMPNVLADLPDADRAATIEALVHFLASTGSVPQERPDQKGINTGGDLYNKVGCVACHGTRDKAGNQAKMFASTVPLGDLKAKYSITSLRVFLESPHATRPSARMPGLLSAKEAQEVANYLLQGTAADRYPANLTYAYFEGAWKNLPDMSKLKPKATGKAGGFDLGLAKRAGDYALQFDGYLRIDKAGDYTFHLTSDDGSKLFIADKLVVNHDGVHAPSIKSGKTKLTQGMHKFRVAMFNAGGGAELSVEFDGSGLGRQSVVPYLYATEEAAPIPVKNDPDHFALQPELIKKGQELFVSVGCASCHQMTVDKKPLTAKIATPLAKLKPESGCLDKTPGKGQPRYALSQPQRDAISAALKSPIPTTAPAATEVITRTLTTFNCYACHVRDKVGGVEEDVNATFLTAQQEMGDEGRIPPNLTGVGAKLTATYMKKVLDLGAHDRPYMHTRMPRFGDANVGHLGKLFSDLDKLEDVPAVTFSQPMAKVKAEGRHLVGAQLLGCIKCHTFAGNKAEGVQGIDMTVMTERVKREWFHQYLLDPNKFRPGTRMPTAWPNGKTLLPKILEGDASKQVEAIYVYLNDKKPLLPIGVKKQYIPLIPIADAIIYRNFLEGAGSRAIGVGYPEKANLAFDANNVRLAMIWQGAFIDAARHWTDRGVGYEPPLGDSVLHLPTGVSFATLAKPEDPWPTKPAKELGYRFLGYKLGAEDRPTFLYSLGDLKIEDFPNAVAGKTLPTIVRTLTVTGQGAENLYFRAAAANKIEALEGGWYSINGEWKMRVDGPARLRMSEKKVELLVPLQLKDGSARIVQEFAW